MLGSSRWSSTHWAVTSAVSRLMVVSFRCPGCPGGGQMWWGSVGSRRACALEQEVHLAAEAEAEGRVEERRGEREAGGDRAEQVGPGGEPEPGRRRANPSPTACANRGGAASSSSAGVPRRGRSEGLEQPGVRRVLDAGDGPDREHGHLYGEQGDRAADGARTQRRREDHGRQRRREPRAARVDLHAVDRCRRDGWSWTWRSPARESAWAAGQRHGHVDGTGEPGHSSSFRGGRRPSGHSTQRRAHAAVVHCAALGEHGREHDARVRRAEDPPETTVSRCGRSVHYVGSQGGASISSTWPQGHECSWPGSISSTWTRTAWHLRPGLWMTADVRTQRWQRRNMSSPPPPTRCRPRPTRPTRRRPSRSFRPLTPGIPSRPARRSQRG